MRISTNNLIPNANFKNLLKSLLCYVCLVEMLALDKFFCTRKIKNEPFLYLMVSFIL